MSAVIQQTWYECLGYSTEEAAVRAGCMPASPNPYPFQRPTTPQPDIALQWASDFPEDEASLQEIVQGVLIAGGMSCMYGESNSGKSYLATHLAFCMTRGIPWLGKRTQRGAVIYIAGEGAASIRRRVRAHERHFGVKVGPFGLVPHALSLLDGSADVEALVPLIQQAKSDVGEEVQLVIVDTLARAMSGGDENSPQDMGRLVRAGDRIRELTGAHVMWIHHSGKDVAKGARGHSSLRAALDTELEVTADDAQHLHTAEVTKQRDLDTKGQRLCGRFVSVALGESQWGEPITACAVEDAAAPAPKAKGRLGVNQKAILAILQGAGKDMLVAEIAQHLEVSRTSAYNSLKPLADAGMVEVSLGRVHLIRGLS